MQKNVGFSTLYDKQGQYRRVENVWRGELNITCKSNLNATLTMVYPDGLNRRQQNHFSLVSMYQGYYTLYRLIYKTYNNSHRFYGLGFAKTNAS